MLFLDVAVVVGCALLAAAVVRRWRPFVPYLGAAFAAALLVSVLALAAALWRVDPALEYVARHASDLTPLPYRLAALWGGMEGSLLFWALVVAVVTVAGIARTTDAGSRAAIALVGGGAALAATIATRGLGVTVRPARRSQRRRPRAPRGAPAPGDDLPPTDPLRRAGAGHTARGHHDAGAVEAAPRSTLGQRHPAVADGELVGARRRDRRRQPVGPTRSSDGVGSGRGTRWRTPRSSPGWR